MSFPSRDNVLDALLHPFTQGLLHWPDGALFLRARMAGGVQGKSFVATQGFRPEAARLQQQGIVLLDEDALPCARFPLVLVLPPRQREEARALLARACAAVAAGGVVLAAVANDEGAKTREAELKQLAGGVATLSKHHCRVFWTRPDAAFDAELVARWRVLDVPRRIACDEVPGGGFLSRPGVFAWDRVDAASRMLAAVLPADLRGQVADFGAGWGYLSQQVLARCPQVASLDLFEADDRALALARQNLAGARVPVDFHWQDVESGVADRFDAIVCNPPFHALGRGERPDIGRAFIAAAAAALKPRGSLWLVANRHLPYEEALGAGFTRLRDVAQDGGFKIVHAVKA
ncbi:MAG: methyltransferase [Xanthomonadaceae bacterium]|nr:methyltransferase [Xanthomonadaceae bacterium]